MNPDRARQSLTELRPRAEDELVKSPTPDSETWLHSVRSVLSRALGSDHHLVATFDAIHFYPGATLGYMDEAEYRRKRARVYRSGIAHAKSVIDAALFEFETGGGDSTRPSAANIDRELWAHVQKIVESADWQNLPAAVAIFVESKVRAWSDLGRDTYGKVLYQKAFADDGELRLGGTRGEWGGWRALATGLATAVGNSDRHHIQQRDDMERYAMGVLGLGSLILTQVRHQHAEIIAERDATSTPS
jgi:hypothetical protein